MRDGDNFWNGVMVVGIVLIIVGVGMLISSPGISSMPVAKIEDFKIGYLSESDYNDGEYDDASIVPETVFTKGVPQYMVVDITIKTISNDVGDESVKIMPRFSNNDAASMMIQEAPTGRVETTTFGDGTRSFELYYKISENKNDVKTVRMILKITPLAEGEFTFDIYADGKVKGETRLKYPMRIVSGD